MATTYFLWGYHGGYVLAGQKTTAKSIRIMRDIMEREPDVVIDFDLEAYTLDRMQNGAALDVERTMSHDRWKDAPTLEILRSLAAAGRLSIVSTYTQPFLYALDGESCVRQFSRARRVTRETLGIEFDTYWAQEPCWTGQLPAILAGFGFRGVYFCNSWAVFGACPENDGEKLLWRGPDGSVIPTIPRSRYASQPVTTRPGDAERWDYWQHGVRPTRERIASALANGVEHPVFGSLGKDLFPRNTVSPHAASKDEDAQVEVEMTSLARYLDIARDDGVWEDAFAEFDVRFPWGLWGGYFLRDQRDAADAALLAERLEVLAGADWSGEIRRIWDLAMLAQHHDYWALLMPVGGPYPRLGKPWSDMPGEFLAESRRRLERLLRRRPAAAFALANATGRTRTEWTPLDVEVPETLQGRACVKDASGRAVPSRLAVEPGGGKRARAIGFFLAEVAPFAVALYRVATGGECAPLPTFASLEPSGAWVIGNGTMTLRVSTEAVHLTAGGHEVVSGVRLEGCVDGSLASSVFEKSGAAVGADGIARAFLEGNVGTLPLRIEFALMPWGRAAEVTVRCDFSGQRVEGETHEDMSGSLKAIFEHPAAAAHSACQAFELRHPPRPHYFAVHSALSQWHGAGMAVALDRPSGVIFGDEALGVVLAHSGAYPYGVDFDKAPMAGHDIITRPQTYRLAIVPFDEAGKADALHLCDERRFPLTVIPGVTHRRAARALSGLAVSGHSIVSALHRDGDAVTLRLWNPLDAETATIGAPGMSIAETDLEGRLARPLAEGAATVEIGPMQIRTLVLREANRPAG